MQEVRQRGATALLHQFIADQKMSADLRDLEREIEIGRKVHLGAALAAFSFTALAAGFFFAMRAVRSLSCAALNSSPPC